MLTVGIYQLGFAIRYGLILRRLSPSPDKDRVVIMLDDLVEYPLKERVALRQVCC